MFILNNSCFMYILTTGCAYVYKVRAGKAYWKLSGQIQAPFAIPPGKDLPLPHSQSWRFGNVKFTYPLPGVEQYYLVISPVAFWLYWLSYTASLDMCIGKRSAKI